MEINANCVSTFHVFHKNESQLTGQNDQLN